MEFYNPPNTRKPRIREFFDVVWKNYEVNQFQKKSLFNQVERIKVVEWHVSKTMNLGELSVIQKDIVDNKMRGVRIRHKTALNDVFFPLHDYYKLKGHDYIKAFEVLLKGKNIFTEEDVIQNKSKKKVEEFDKQAQQITSRSIKNFVLNIFNKLEPAPLTESRVIAQSHHRQSKKMISIEDEQHLLKVPQNGKTEVNGDVKRDQILRDSRKELKALTDLFQNADKDEIVKDGNELDDVEEEFYAQQNPDLALLDINRVFKKGVTIDVDEEIKEVEAEDDKAVIKGNPLNRYKERTKTIYKLDKPIWPLDQVFVIYPFAPWKIAYRSLMHYFGERLSLYFRFTSFYATMLIVIMFFAFGVYAIDFACYFIDTDTNKKWRNANAILYLILSLAVILWGNMFYWTWLRKERQFVIETGYENSLEDRQRVNFKNAIVSRSLVNDFVNSKQPDYTIINLKLFLVFLATLACYAVSLGCTIGLFYLKNYTVEKLPDEDWAYINQNIANGIEVVKIIVFDYLFYKLAIKMVAWVDPKYMTEFDNFLIVIVMTFSILNNYFILILIIFIKSSADNFIKCAEQEQNIDNNVFKSYCCVEAEIFFKLYVIGKIVHNMARWIWANINKRYIKYVINDQKSKIDEVNSKREMHLQASEMTEMLRSMNKYAHRSNYSNDNFNYSELNRLIEIQVYLDISNDSDDFDSTLQHYLEIVLSFTGLCWFGILFPFSFLLFYVTTVFELYIDKSRYFDNLRRPSPHGKAVLGLWNYILSLIAMLAVFTNSYIIAFLYTEDGIFGIDTQDSKNLLFIVLIMIGFLIGIIVASFSYGTPDNVVFMAERQEFIRNKVMATRISGIAMDTEVAVIKSNVSAWGEIDYEHYDMQRERKTKKLLEEVQEE